MNTELEKIVDWFNINKLSLNPDKTNYILFRSPRKKINDINLYLNKIPITQSHTSTFLGVIIDQYLSWKDHIALVCKKVSKNIGIIAKIRYCLSFQNLKNLYYTLIFPYLRPTWVKNLRAPETRHKMRYWICSSTRKGLLPKVRLLAYLLVCLFICLFCLFIYFVFYF